MRKCGIFKRTCCQNSSCSGFSAMRPDHNNTSARRLATGLPPSRGGKSTKAPEMIDRNRRARRERDLSAQDEHKI